MTANKSAIDAFAIEGCRIRVAVDGDEMRPALVLSHMLGTDLSLWDDLLPALSARFRVIRLDARGHGQSDLGAAPVTIERLGRDVVAVLDALGVGRAHFLGLSMGGAVGLWLLAHAPARIERAVIAGSGAKLGDPASWNARISTALSSGMAPAIEPTIERWFSPDYLTAEPARVDRIRGLVRATSPAGFAACSAALRDMDLREAVRAVANPVLVIRGADDPSATATDAEHLTTALENASFVELPARHCLAVEVEAAFVEAAVRFLSSKSVPRRAATDRTPAKTLKGKSHETRPVSAIRRAASRGLGDARRPVTGTVPVSGKAVAKASAARKTGARNVPRAAESAGSRRRPSAKPAVRSATRKAAAEASHSRVAAAAKVKMVARKVTRKSVAEPATSKRSTGPARKAAAKAAAKPAAKAAAKPPIEAAAKSLARKGTVPAPKRNARAAGGSSGSGARPVTAAALRAARAGSAPRRKTAVDAPAAKSGTSKTKVGRAVVAVGKASGKTNPAAKIGARSSLSKTAAGKTMKAETAAKAASLKAARSKSDPSKSVRSKAGVSTRAPTAPRSSATLSPRGRKGR